jgi:hypothetical protein
MRWRWIAGITAGLALVAVGWPIVRAAMGPSLPLPSDQRAIAFGNKAHVATIDTDPDR